MYLQVVKYLSHVHPMHRTIYLTRHGQSTYNLQKKIGGNPGLTPAGEQYATWLGQWVPKEVWPEPLQQQRSGVQSGYSLASPASGRGPNGSGGSSIWSSMNASESVSGDKLRPARLWTSTLKRTIDTARHIPHPDIRLENGAMWQQMAPRVYRNLDEIFAGEYEGLTYKEVEEQYEVEAGLRKMDKLGYRYPRGESYLDLIAR